MPTLFGRWCLQSVDCSSAMLCPAVLCHAMPCCAMLCCDPPLQIRKFQPKMVAIKDASKVKQLQELIKDVPQQPEILVGDEGAVEVRYSVGLYMYSLYCTVQFGTVLTARDAFWEAVGMRRAAQRSHISTYD